MAHLLIFSSKYLESGYTVLRSSVMTTSFHRILVTSFQLRIVTLFQVFALLVI